MESPADNTADYLDSVELPGLNLEIYAEPAVQTKVSAFLPLAEPLWTEFLKVAQEAHIFDTLGLSPTEQVLEVDLHWVGNETMQTLNRQYRGKDSATDVLSFTLFADQPDTSLWSKLPVVQLGSIFIGLEWAEAEVLQNSDLNLKRYVAERWLHGYLHLLGQHHDTMEEFNRVVKIQQSVLDSVFIQTDTSGSYSTVEATS